MEPFRIFYFTIYSFNKAMNTHPIPSLNWLSFFNGYTITISLVIYILLHIIITIDYNKKVGKTLLDAIRDSLYIIFFYLSLIPIIFCIGIITIIIHLFLTWN